MSSRPDRRFGGVLGTLLFAVVVVVASYAMVHRQREHAADHATRFAGAQTMLNLASYVPEQPLGVALEVAILRDSATDAYYDSRATMDSVVLAWSSALGRLGAHVRVVTPAQAVAARDARVLVVPASPCLGMDSRRAIAEFTNRGAGVVATWLAGVRDGGCKRVGYGLVAALSGASRLDTLEPRPENYITFLRGGPLASDVPPGARLEVLVGNQVAVRTPLREAFYSDFQLNPQPAQQEALLDGAVAIADVGHGRAVYWGFDLSRVAPRPWDQEIALRLARNSVLWAAGVPLAAVKPWPDGKEAAAVIAQDVEDQFDNARYAVDSLRAAHVPGTFFLVSNLALQNRDLVKQLAAAGEIGTHTPQHKLLGGEPAAQQLAQLQQTQKDLASLIGHPVAGLRPPEEQFDTTTLGTWEGVGGQYVFGANNSRTASPEILEVRGKPLVLLGRVTNDDFLSVKRAGRTNVQVLSDEYLSAFDKISALGGLYILSYHSQLMSRPELVPALASVARHLAADSTLWLTTAGNVAHWWLARSQVEANARYLDPTHVLLTVANHGAAPLAHVDVRVLLGDAQPVDIRGGTLAEHDAYSVTVRMPTLAASSTVSATIVLARPVHSDAPGVDAPPSSVTRTVASAH